MKRFILATALALLTTTPALADEHSYNVDAAAYNDCFKAVATRDPQTTRNHCQRAAARLVFQIGHEDGDNNEQVRYWAAYSTLALGSAEMALGETTMGATHVGLSGIGFRAVLENSADPELLDAAQQGLDTIQKIASR